MLKIEIQTSLGNNFIVSYLLLLSVMLGLLGEEIVVTTSLRGYARPVLLAYIPGTYQLPSVGSWLWQEGALMVPILSPDGGLGLPFPSALQPTTVKISVLKMC